MAFSDYKNLAQVQQQFNITYQEEKFLVIQEYQVPATFLSDFEFWREHLDIYASTANIFTKHPENYTIDNLGKLFGAIDLVLQMTLFQTQDQTQESKATL